jgi:hypothetical protein
MIMLNVSADSPLSSYINSAATLRPLTRF